MIVSYLFMVFSWIAVIISCHFNEEKLPRFKRKIRRENGNEVFRKI